MESHMSSILYKAATAGDVHFLPSYIDVVSEQRNGLLSLTHEENNCLHIAARFGHEEFVQRVLSLCPSLLYQQNKKGDNPLHVAARAGHLHVVKLLTGSFQQNSQSTIWTSGNRATAVEEIPSERSPREAEEGEITIQNQENSTTLTDSLQPPPTSQSQCIGNSATLGNDIILERSLREAEEGERPSHPIWRTQIQQNSMALTDSFQPPRSSQSERTLSERPSLPIWRSKNHDGSTALHDALRSKHKDVALHLLDMEISDSKLLAVLVVNARDETPLYLAAEAGFDLVLIKILEILSAGGHIKTVVDESNSNAVLDEKCVNFVGPKGQTPLHAAVFTGSAENIQVLHESILGLIKKRDSYGKTALYYATQANCLKIMHLLLKLDASSAYICDNEGLSPLLVAASMCTLASFRAILDACPSSIESSDNNGHNVLHLALINNTFLMLLRLLKIPEVTTLINEPDQEGNTPLHLATKGDKYFHVLALLYTERVDLTAKNNVGKTALDMCASYWELSALQIRWKLILRRKAYMMGHARPLRRLHLKQISTRRVGVTDLKEISYTLSVVATLLGTITFAAPFQMPGGYKNGGSPSLIHKPALKVFLLSDTIALCCSVVALLLHSYDCLYFWFLCDNINRVYVGGNSCVHHRL